MAEVRPDDAAPRQARIPEAAAGRRFDAVLAELFPEYSRSRLSAWIKAGDVLLDGAPARPRDLVRGGEAVSLNAEPEDQTLAEPEDIPLDILYEDSEVFVLDKPAGLVVHPVPEIRPAPWSTACCTATRAWRPCRGRASSIAWTRTPRG